MKNLISILLSVSLTSGLALADVSSIDHKTCIINYSIEHAERIKVDAKLQSVLVNELNQKGYTAISSNGYLPALPFPLLVLNIRLKGYHVSPLFITAEQNMSTSVDAELELLVRTNIVPEVLESILKKNQSFETAGSRNNLDQEIRKFVTGLPECHTTLSVDEPNMDIFMENY
ncbi:MAG: hypothetical protein ABIQ95_14110 [Bdellovibrionia bacterium]